MCCLDPNILFAVIQHPEPRRDRDGRPGGVLHPGVQEEGVVDGLHSAVCAEDSCQDYS